jgi:hypothetical protein
MRYLLISISVLFLFVNALAQTNTNLRTLEKKGDSLYLKRNYLQAINNYKNVADQTDFSSKKAAIFYNMGCCFSLHGDDDSAFNYLAKAVENGYDNKDWMIVDKDLLKLHNLPRWKPLVNSVKSTKTLNSDPLRASFHTDDIHHFWAAYDKALEDTAHFRSIFKQMYFDVASRGLKEYLGAKVSSIDSYLASIKSMPKYYSAIRGNTLYADNLKPTYIAIFQHFKTLYQPAVFPDVYFLMGGFNAGGTATHAGLLIAMDQTAKDATIPLDELNSKNKSGLDDIANLPLAVAHELIHYQQDGMKMSDTTVLGNCIIEGMADFFAELSGHSPGNLYHYKWAEGKEKEIWKKFKKEMYTGKFRPWIYLNENTTDDNPPMQGYWVGCQICKAYYEKAADKKKAVYDMLHLQDYKQFLAKSGWEKKLERSY